MASHGVLSPLSRPSTEFERENKLRHARLLRLRRAENRVHATAGPLLPLQLPSYRSPTPSPNEEAAWARAEWDRRRRTRLLQVREQEKLLALRQRSATREEMKRQERRALQNARAEWEAQRHATLENLEAEISHAMGFVGTAHRLADVHRRDMHQNALANEAIYEAGECARSVRGIRARRVEEERRNDTIQPVSQAQRRREAVREAEQNRSKAAVATRRAFEATRPPPQPVSIPMPPPLTVLHRHANYTHFSQTRYHTMDVECSSRERRAQETSAISFAQEEVTRRQTCIREQTQKKAENAMRAEKRGKNAMKEVTRRHQRAAMEADLAKVERIERQRKQHAALARAEWGGILHRHLMEKNTHKHVGQAFETAFLQPVIDRQDITGGVTLEAARIEDKAPTDCDGMNETVSPTPELAAIEDPDRDVMREITVSEGEASPPNVETTDSDSPFVQWLSGAPLAIPPSIPPVVLTITHPDNDSSSSTSLLDAADRTLPSVSTLSEISIEEPSGGDENHLQGLVDEVQTKLSFPEKESETTARLARRNAEYVHRMRQRTEEGRRLAHRKTCE